MAGSTRKNDKYYKLLSRNMIIIIVVVSFAPLILIGAIVLDRFSTAYHSKVTQLRGELVQKHSQNIDRFLQDRLADIRVLARSYTVEQLMDPSFLKNTLSLLREEYKGVYVDLGLVSAEGRQVSYAGPLNLIDADYDNADWFRKTLESEDHISDVFTGLRGAPHFIVAAKKAWEGRVWILRATIDFEAFNSLVDNIRIGQTGFAFVLNQAGEFQTNIKSHVFLNRGPYLDFLKGRMESRQVSVVERDDENGLKWIVAMAPLKNGQWIVCAQQTSKEAFAVLSQTRNTALLVFIVGGLVIVIVAFLVSKRMVGRIARADQEKTVMNEKIIETGRLASIGELAAGVAHEINNPVAIMVEEAGWIEDIMSDEDPTSRENLAELKRAARQIKTQGNRCKQITHKLLSFSRRTDPKVSEVDLNQVVNDTLSLLQQKTRYANVRLETALDPHLSPVAASASEMQQVMLNLVNNAVDAVSPEGGAVLLTTRNNQGRVVFEVADTGHGIPEAILSRIFDPFFTTKPVGQGTGLGLSICFGIINKLGGEISVRSAVGQGTVFTVRLPAVSSSTGKAEDTALQSVEPSGRNVS